MELVVGVEELFAWPSLDAQAGTRKATRLKSVEALKLIQLSAEIATPIPFRNLDARR